MSGARGRKSSPRSGEITPAILVGLLLGIGFEDYTGL